ncbi:serine/threonine protein kinase, putative [Plasmodium relictum]|uniref:Serine/threonine protein kinase, putative n=1 Tax=Plasmodium relictum TaxID=85471 RepID=A0A1J1HB18_PLARL|nr:serine/threonine protein kinase, putative [Plasmodium relictum]CRH00791.1 serine/threonine protein kinase, putative [Plasmodium relictum]
MQGINMQEYYLDKIQKNISQIKKAQNICLCQSIHEDKFNVNNNYIANNLEYNDVSNNKKNIFVLDKNTSKEMSYETNLNKEMEIKEQYINNNNCNNECINDYDRCYNVYNNKINNNTCTKPIYLSNNFVENEDINMLKYENLKYCKNKLIMANDTNNSNNNVIEKNNNLIEIEGNKCFNNSPLNNAKLINYKTNKSININYVKSDENNLNIINNSTTNNKGILANYLDKKDNENNNITLLTHLNSNNNQFLYNKITCYKNNDMEKNRDSCEHFINHNCTHNYFDKINIKSIDKNCKDYAIVDYSKNHVTRPNAFHEIHSKNVVNHFDKYNIKILENQNNINNVHFYEGNDTSIKNKNVSNIEKTTKSILNFQNNKMSCSSQRCNDEHIKESEIITKMSNNASLKNINKYYKEPSKILYTVQVKDQIGNSRDDSLEKNNLQHIFYNNYEKCQIHVDHLISNNLKDTKKINHLNKLYSSIVLPHCTHLSTSEKKNSNYSVMFKNKEDNKIYKNEKFTTNINLYEEKKESNNLQFPKNKIENVAEISCNFQNGFHREKMVINNLPFPKKYSDSIISETNKKENSNKYSPFLEDKTSSTIQNVNNNCSSYINEKTSNDSLVIPNNVNDEKKSMNNLEKDNLKKEKGNENEELYDNKKCEVNTDNSYILNTENTQIITLDSLQDQMLKENLLKKQYIEQQENNYSNDLKYISTNKHNFEKREEKKNNAIKSKDENIKNEKIIDKERNKKNGLSEWSKFDVENIMDVIKDKKEQILEDEKKKKNQVTQSIIEEKMKNREKKDMNEQKTDTQTETLKDLKEQTKNEEIEQNQLRGENIEEQEQLKKKYTDQEIHNEIEGNSLGGSNKVQELDNGNYDTNETGSNFLYIKNDNVSINEKELEKELELYFKKEGFLVSSNSLYKISEKDEFDLCYANTSKKNFLNFSKMMKSVNTELSEKEYEISSSSIDQFDDDIFVSNSDENATNKHIKDAFCTNEYKDEVKKKKNSEKKKDDLENKIDVFDISNIENGINTNCRTIREKNNDDHNSVEEKNRYYDFLFSKNKNLLFIDLLKNKCSRREKYLDDKLEHKYNILTSPNFEKEKNLIDKIIYCLDPSYVNNTLDEKMKWKQKLKYMQEKFLESILCVSYPNHLWNETNFEEYLESLNFNSLLDDTFIKYEGDLNINLFQKEEEIFSDAGNIGEGGFGIVTKMRFLTGSKYYAIKKISKEHIIKSQAAGQAYLEAKYHSVLSHVNIIKMYGCMQDDQYIYHILEFCSKGSIYSISKNFKKRIIPDELAYKYFCHIVNGLYYLNQMGIFHRDIKMENVLVDHKDNAKLSDFGLSAMILGKKSHSSLCGTLVYFSPEITSGNGYDWRSDIWSLGVLLYEMLVGDVPFDGTKTQIVESIFSCDLKFPDFVNPLAINLIKKALVVDVNKRIKLCELSSDPWMQEMWKMAFQKDLKKKKNIKPNINEEGINFNFISTLIQAECFIKSSLNASLNYNINKNINEIETNSTNQTKENIDFLILETQKKLADYLDLEDYYMNEEKICSSDSISERHSDSFISYFSDHPLNIKNEILVDKYFKENKMNHEQEINENIPKENYNDKESISQNVNEETKKDALKMNKNNDLVNNEKEITVIEEKYLINNKDKDLINNENIINEELKYNEIYSNNLKIDVNSKEKEINMENEKSHYPINISESLQINNEEVISKSNNTNNSSIVMNNNNSIHLRELNSKSVDSNIIEKNTKYSYINNKLGEYTKKNEDICTSQIQDNKKKEVKKNDMKEALDSQNISNIKNLENISNDLSKKLYNDEKESRLLEKLDDTLIENKNLDYYDDKNYPIKNISISCLSSLSQTLDTKKKSLCEKKLEMETENNELTTEKSKNTNYDVHIVNDCNKDVSTTNKENNDICKIFTHIESEERNENNKNFDNSSIDVNYKSSSKNEELSEIDESYIPINVLKKKIGEIINESNSRKINLELRDSFLHDKSENVEKLNNIMLEKRYNIKHCSTEKLKSKILDVKASKHIKEINDESNKINNFNSNISIYKSTKKNYENEKNFNELNNKATMKSRCTSEKIQNKIKKNSYVENIDSSIKKEVETILGKTIIGKYHKQDLTRRNENGEESTLNESKSILKSEKNSEDNIFLITETRNDDVIITEESSLYDKYIDKINELYQNIKNKKLVSDVETMENITSENNKIVDGNDNIDFENKKKCNEKNKIKINNCNNNSIQNSFKEYSNNMNNNGDHTSKYVEYSDNISKNKERCINNYLEYNRNSEISYSDSDKEVDNNYINAINKGFSDQSNIKNTKLNDFCCTKETYKSEICKNKKTLLNNNILKMENNLYNKLKDEKCLGDKLATFKKKITNDPSHTVYIEKKEKTFLELKEKIVHDNNLNIKSRITPDFFAPNTKNFHSSNSENGDFICEKDKEKYCYMNEYSLSSSNSDYSNDKQFYIKYKRNKINLDNNNPLKNDGENYRNIKYSSKHKNKLDYDKYKNTNAHNDKKMKNKEKNINPFDVLCFDNKVTFMASQSETESGNASKITDNSKASTQKNNSGSKRNICYKISNLELISRIHKNKLSNSLDDKKRKKRENNLDEKGSKQISTIGNMNKESTNKNLMKSASTLEMNTKKNEIEKNKLQKKDDYIALKNKRNNKNEIKDDSVIITKRNTSMNTNLSTRNVLEKESDIQKNKMNNFLDLLNEKNEKCNELINNNINKDASKKLEKDKLDLINDEVILNMEKKNDLCTFKNVEDTKLKNIKCKINESVLQKNRISIKNDYNILFNKGKTICFHMEKNKKTHDNKIKKNRSVPLRNMESLTKVKNTFSEKVNNNIDIRNNCPSSKKKDDNSNTKECFIREKNLKENIPNTIKNQSKFCNNKYENSLVHGNKSIPTMNIKDKALRINTPSKDIIKNNNNFMQKNKKVILEKDLKNSKVKQYLKNKIEKIKNKNDNILCTIENEKGENRYINMDLYSSESNSLYSKNEQIYQKINIDTDVNEGKRSVSEFSFSSNSKKFSNQKNYNELKLRKISTGLQKCGDNMILETQKKNKQAKTLSRSKSESIKYFTFSSSESDVSLSFTSVEKNEKCELDKFQKSEEQKKKKKSENEVSKLEDKNENIKTEETKIKNKNVRSNIMYKNNSLHRKMNFSNVKSKINTNIYKKSKNEGNVLTDGEKIKLNENGENNRRAKSAKVPFKSNNALYNLNFNTSNSITLKDKMKKKDNLINNYDSKNKDVILCKRLNSLPVTRRLVNDKNNKIKTFNKNSFGKTESVKKMKTSFFKTNSNTKYEEELQNKLLSLNKKQIYDSMNNYNKNNINNNYNDYVTHNIDKGSVTYVSSSHYNNIDTKNISDNYNIKNFYENDTCNKQVNFNGDKYNTILCNNNKCTMRNCQKDGFNSKVKNLDEKEKINYNKEKANLIIGENNKLMYKNNHFYNREGTLMKNCYLDNSISNDLNKININSVMNYNNKICYIKRNNNNNNNNAPFNIDNENNKYISKFDKSYHMNTKKGDTNTSNTKSRNEIYINEGYKTNNIYLNNLSDQISSVNIGENNGAIKRNHTCSKIMNIRHINSVGSETGFINSNTNAKNTQEKRVNLPSFYKSSNNNEIHLHNNIKNNIKNEQNKYELQMNKYLNTNIDEYNTNRYALPYSIQNCLNNSSNSHKNKEKKENTKLYYGNYIRKANKINNYNVEELKGNVSETNINTKLSTIFKLAKNKLLKSNDIKKSPSNSNMMNCNINPHALNNKNNNIPKSSYNKNIKNSICFHHDKIEQESRKTVVGNHEKNNYNHNNYNMDMLNKGLIVKFLNSYNPRCIKEKDRLSIPNNINVSHNTLESHIYNNSEKKQLYNNSDIFKEKEHSFCEEKNKAVRILSTNSIRQNCENYSYDGNEKYNSINHKDEEMNNNYNTEKKKIRIAINKHGKEFFLNSSLHVIK